MKPKQRLRVGFPGMAHCGVPAAATIEILAPRDRVIAAHRSAAIGRFIKARQDMNGTAGMAGEPGADEAAVPRPVILGVARRMDPDEATARADVAFERSLLLRIENVP